MTLPADIQQIFLDTLSGDRSVSDFEQWLYADKRLEVVINSDDYLDLISYGYKDADAKYGLFKLLEKVLEKHMDKGELETKRIYALLTKALKRDKELPEILIRFYDLYCEGYRFLEKVGIGYGLRVYAPGINNYEDTWGDLTESEKAILLDSFYPDLENDIKEVISWLESGKIILIGIKNEFDPLEYFDNRTHQDQRPARYQLEKFDKVTKTEPWWKFW